MRSMWNYRNPAWSKDDDLVGCDVVAADGNHIGKVVEATHDDGHDRIIVDTGHWIFGTKRAIPAGTVADVDHDTRTIRVNMTKDDIEGAPEHHSDRWVDQSYRQAHERHYEDHVRVV